eukprot:scaffold9190_cov81-Skeletonema_dohrnii-CCMP3373.AAC.1
MFGFDVDDGVGCLVGRQLFMTRVHLGWGEVHIGLRIVHPSLLLFPTIRLLLLLYCTLGQFHTLGNEYFMNTRSVDFLDWLSSKVNSKIYTVDEALCAGFHEVSFTRDAKLYMSTAPGFSSPNRKDVQNLEDILQIGLEDILQIFGGEEV